MKISIERSVLLKAVAQAQSVVERRNTIPILSNVLIDADANGVILRATDLDIEVLDRAPAGVDRTGSTTVNAVTLHDIVRKLPEGALVNLSDDPAAGRLTVQAGRSTFSLATLPREDFPQMASSEYTTNFAAPAAELRRLFDKAKFAISTEETRYYLNGIYLHHAKAGKGNVLRAVATDGHRLALAEAEAPKGASSLKGVIVPRKAVAEVRRLLDDAPEIVTVEASDSKIVFRIGEAVLTSKLIDGSFPDYQRVIPKDNKRILSVPTKLFKDAVDRVATVSAERSRSVKLSLSSGRLMLAVTHSESGHGAEDVEAEYSSEPMEIGFNAKYLLDVAGQIESDETRIEFNDPASPARVIDAKDAGAEYVLMPLRV